MSASVSAAPSDAITATGAMSFVDTSVPDLVDRALDTGDAFEENGAEPRERYLFSGLHYPICIGQVLDQKYRIEHKLAFPLSGWLMTSNRRGPGVAGGITPSDVSFFDVFFL